jgi:hypothetical protein
MSGRHGTEYTLSHDRDGLVLSWLTLEDEQGHASLSWGQVTRIEAFKRDLYAVDLICLALETQDSDTLVIHEEMPGWQALLDALPGYLPGFPPEGAWLAKVAIPAFETNLTTLFTKNAGTAA